MKELWSLALESVADELKNPSDQKEGERINPQPVNEDAGDKNRQRKQNGRNAERMAKAVRGMPMTGSVLRDPLFVSASAQHARDDITIRRRVPALPVFRPAQNADIRQAPKRRALRAGRKRQPYNRSE